MLITGTGLLLLLLLNSVLDITGQGYIYNDSDNYREAASLLYRNGMAHYYRPLLMAAITGLPYLFGGDDTDVYRFSLLLNITCWIGTALLLYELLKVYIFQKTAFVGALIYILLLSPAFTVFHLLTESLYTFLTLLVFLLLVKYHSQQRYRDLTVALGVLMLLMLIRPGAMLLSGIFLLYYSRTLISNIRHRATLILIACAGLIVLQCYMVKRDYGNFTLSYIDSVTYYNYMGARAKALEKGEPFRQDSDRAQYILKHPYPLQKEIAGKDLKAQLEQNPRNLFRAYTLDIFDNSKAPCGHIAILKNIHNTSLYRPLQTMLAAVSKYQNRLLSACGLLLALYYATRIFKKDPVPALLSVFILYTIGTSGVSCAQGDRFHMVFFPIVIFLLLYFIGQKGRSGMLR